MLLNLTTTHEPATDLGFLLHKNPGRVHETSFGFGKAILFFSEANVQKATASLMVEVDPIALVRNRKGGPSGNDFSLAQYVNDRPYAASSFLSVVIGKMLGTAMGGRSKERPELAQTPIPLRVESPAVPCRGGESLLRRLFEPLGYVVTATPIPLDAEFPGWGNSRYLSVVLEGTVRLKDLLEHLFVLIPVLDDDKHYWVGQEEMEKLLRRGGEWLPSHPEKELIAHRYLRHDRRLTTEALARLLADLPEDPDEVEGQHDQEEEAIEAPISLNDQRMAAVEQALIDVDAARVLDLGCGEGKLIRRLLQNGRFQKIVGVDVSYRTLEFAQRRLHFDNMAPKQRERVDLLHGSLTYRDRRLEGFDAAAVVEVIEHLDEPRLAALERSLFSYARPTSVVVTTPNSEYNVKFGSLPAGHMRHRDHRFEWTRAEFQDWAQRVGSDNGYSVDFRGVGPTDDVVGTPTQMAVFRR